MDFSFIVPEGFELIEQNEFRGLYQNGEGHIFAYNFGKEKIDNVSKLDVIVPFYMYELSQSLDNFELWTNGREFVVNGHNYYWFEYTTSIEDEMSYHFTYITVVNSRQFTIAFACPFEDADVYGQTVGEVLGSIEYEMN